MLWKYLLLGSDGRKKHLSPQGCSAEGTNIQLRDLTPLDLGKGLSYFNESLIPLFTCPAAGLEGVSVCLGVVPFGSPLTLSQAEGWSPGTAHGFSPFLADSFLFARFLQKWLHKKERSSWIPVSNRERFANQEKFSAQFSAIPTQRQFWIENPLLVSPF